MSMDFVADLRGRRRFLLGLGTGAAATLLRPAAAADPSDPVVTQKEELRQERQPFYGLHQPGVVTPQPAAALYAAFDVLANDRQGLERLFRVLTERIAFLMHGGPAAVADPGLPPPDSGILGPEIPPDNLSVTVAVGDSLFEERRFGLSVLKPRHLQRMQSFSNDRLDRSWCHGDLLLSFNANTAETVIHALRDLVKNTPDLLALRWKIEGFLPPDTLKRQGRDTVRNLLGFKDGTANLDTTDAALMERVVWVGKGGEEPAWAQGGTYQAVRLIRMLVERWDRTPLREQEQIFGRDKAEGAPLGKPHEHDLPDYASDPEGKVIPLDAHIRLANPRTPGSERNLVLRRSYNYSRGVDNAGQLDMGLIFTCFQADLAAGFLTVQSRLDGEPLEEYIKPFGGGYFFVLPGVREPGDWLGRTLMVQSA